MGKRDGAIRLLANVERLVRLIELDAPVELIRTELDMIEQKVDKLKRGI